MKLTHKQEIDRRREEGELKDLQHRAQWEVFKGNPIARAYTQKQNILIPTKP